MRQLSSRRRRCAREGLARRGSARKRAERGDGPLQHAGARRDGECRRGLLRLVEERSDPNESNEHEGAEARSAVRRLAIEGRSGEHAVVGPLSLCGRVTGASFILAGAGAGAVVCSVVFVSLAGFFFFVVATVARFEAADFFAISFASSPALIFFVSSLATSSASKDMWWKILGMGTVTLNLS